MTSREVANLQTSISDDVLFQQVQEQAAILHLGSELYFGLDDVGARMWGELEAGGTVQEVAERLTLMYDAPIEQIRHDLIKFVLELESHGLMVLQE